MNTHVHESMKTWRHKWIPTWIHERLHDYMSTRIREWLRECTKDYKNTWVTTWRHDCTTTRLHDYMNTWKHKNTKAYKHKNMNAWRHECRNNTWRNEEMKKWRDDEMLVAPRNKPPCAMVRMDKMYARAFCHTSPRQKPLSYSKRYTNAKCKGGANLASVSPSIGECVAINRRVCRNH